MQKSADNDTVFHRGGIDEETRKPPISQEDGVFCLGHALPSARETYRLERGLLCII